MACRPSMRPVHPTRHVSGTIRSPLGRNGHAVPPFVPRPPRRSHSFAGRDLRFRLLQRTSTCLPPGQSSLDCCSRHPGRPAWIPSHRRCPGRSAEVRRLIEETAARSAIVRELIARLACTDVIVYVEMTASPEIPRARTKLVTALPGVRFLRIGIHRSMAGRRFRAAARPRAAARGRDRGAGRGARRRRARCRNGRPHPATIDDAALDVEWQIRFDDPTRARATCERRVERRRRVEMKSLGKSDVTTETWTAVDDYITGLMLPTDPVLDAAQEASPRGRPAGDQRVGGAGQVPAPARADPGRAPHPRDRHARRLQHDLAGARAAGGRPPHHARVRSEARRRRARQHRPRRAGRRGRHPRRARHRRAAGAGRRRAVRPRLHRRRQAQHAPTTSTGR